MTRYCGPPAPHGLDEWAGCVLFHHGIDLSVMDVFGLVFLTVCVVRWWRIASRSPASVQPIGQATRTTESHGRTDERTNEEATDRHLPGADPSAREQRP